MIKYLLDTNIMVAYLNEDEMVRAAFRRYEPYLSVSAITAGELVYGAYKSQHWQANYSRLVRLFQEFEIFTINSEIADTYGIIRSVLEEQGLKIGDNDLWIAATAVNSSLTLVTRDKDFKLIKGFQLKIEVW